MLLGQRTRPNWRLMGLALRRLSGAFSNRALEKVGRFSLEDLGKLHEDFEAHPGRPLFELADVGPVNVGLIGKRFLREALLPPDPP